MHHAFFIAGEGETGIGVAIAYIERELGMKTVANPDVIILRHGLLSVDEARSVVSFASQGPIAGDKKAIVISASRAYHEAQNALLKLFEEPTEGTYLFLILPSAGALLPTLRSRIQILNDGFTKSIISPGVEEFLKMNKEKRSAFIKKLASGKDEEERRENRDEALALVNGIEAVAYAGGVSKHPTLLSDISTLRGYLHDRSAPLRMILEHISLVIPKGMK